VPTELVQARSAYHQASDGPAATLVPSDLHKAHAALDEAEAAFEADPKGYHTLDLAYVAQRKAELAEALAAHSAESRNTASANSQYQDTQDAIMQNTRNELGASKSDLAASETAVATTSAKLTASENARVQSENARMLAEQRATAAMEALNKLAAVKEEARGMVITLSGSVLFASDQSTLLPEAQARLVSVVDALLQDGDRALLVEGHTDSQGSDAYNVDLSQRRADAVRSFLITRGYAANLVRATGIGEARPVADNTSAEGRANNRRVEIVVSPLSTATK
jgi:outer membrane protein OmpA-like peptidoglycan-associated protein